MERSGRAVLALCLVAGGAGWTSRAFAADTPEGIDDSPFLEEAGLEEAVLALEDTRTYPSPLLSRLLASRDPSHRARAALALGRIGHPSAVGPLVVALRGEPVGHVRGTVAFALGPLGQPAALRVLIETLARDRSLYVRSRAAQALGLIGNRAALPALLAALPPPGHSPSPERVAFVGHVAVALARLKDPRAAGPLTRLLSADGARDPGLTGVRRAAAWALARLRDPAGGPALAAAMADPDPHIRSFAARGVGGARVSGTAARLRRLLLEPVHAVRIAACRSLGERGVHDGVEGTTDLRQTVEVLSRLSRGRSFPQLRIEAIGALGRLGDPAVREALEALAREGGAAGRAALPGLGRLGVPADALVAMAARDSTVRGGLALVSALEVSKDTRAWGYLGAMARGRGPVRGRGSSEREVLRGAAAAAMAQGATTAQLPLFHLILADPDPIVRAAAVEGLLKVGGASQLAPARAAYARHRGEETDDFKVTYVQGLSGLGAAAREALEEAAADPSRNVRIAAARALAPLSPARPRRPTERARPAPPPVHAVHAPLEIRRPSGFYRDVVELARRGVTAVIETEKGRFAIELLGRRAPLTVASFVALARRGFFDGQAIPRVVPDFVVQMGDPRGDLSGGPGYTIRCEVSDAPYVRGTVGMALSGKDTGGSQFFVTHSPHPHLDGIYTVFGRVVRGMEVLDDVVPGDRIRAVRIEPGPP